MIGAKNPPLQYYQQLFYIHDNYYQLLQQVALVAH